MAKVVPQVDPSKAVRGLEIIAANVGNIRNLALLAGTAFAGWKVTDSFFSSMVTTERQLIQLKTALQSASAGVADYKKAMMFAARTPFPVEQVTQASVMLRVFQFNPFEQVEKGGRDLMTVLGDMAGAMGRDIALAAHALNRELVS